MIDEPAIRLRWEMVGARLDERGRRLFAAAEVWTAGRGGLALVSKITGLARSTINRGKKDFDSQPLPRGRVRRAGGGRRALCETDPGLVTALKRLVEPATLGDPMRPLIWVSKSMEKLAITLTEMGHPISADTVRTELVKLGFSRQSNRKADECSAQTQQPPTRQEAGRFRFCIELRYRFVGPDRALSGWLGVTEKAQPLTKSLRPNAP